MPEPTTKKAACFELDLNALAPLDAVLVAAILAGLSLSSLVETPAVEACRLVDSTMSAYLEGHPEEKNRLFSLLFADPQGTIEIPVPPAAPVLDVDPSHPLMEGNPQWN